MMVKKALFLACLTILPGQVLWADSYGTSTNPPPSPPPPAAQQAPSPQCNANNNTTDPRVPPAGTYKIDHGDGSSEEVYTTGEKKPYYVDNCTNQNTPPIIPQVYVQPPGTPAVTAPAVTR